MIQILLNSKQLYVLLKNFILVPVDYHLLGTRMSLDITQSKQMFNTRVMPSIINKLIKLPDLSLARRIILIFQILDDGIS